MATKSRFSGEITVASRIIDYLSSGLYESPAACIKELVNNSYDADATTVRIFVKPDADRIIIEDDGVGMTREEFIKHFKKISESHKRDDSDRTLKGRPKIGKIGIGFIAANELCNVMQIESTKRGSRELLRVDINFEKMRLDLDKRRRDHDAVAKGDYDGVVEDTSVNSHFTRIFLKEVRGDAREILAGAAAGNADSGSLASLYGKSAETIASELSAPNLASWSEYDSYTINRLKVGLNVPVQYHPRWIPRDSRRKILDLERATEELGFKLYWDGSEILKPIMLNPGERSYLLRRFRHEGDAVSARGYFFVRHGAIKPADLNGMLIRIRNAAVGGYDKTFMGFRTSVGAVFQRWISAEVWADDRLERAMNIDRRTLREAEPAYVELRRAVHAELNELIAEARRVLYRGDNEARRQANARKQLAVLEQVVSSAPSSVSKRTRTSVTSAWAEAEEDEDFEKRMLKKYSVADIYRVVLDVASQVLDPQDLARFVNELTRRLSQ